LIGPAFQVTRDLASKIPTKRFQDWKDRIVDGKERDFWKAVNRPYSFMKHADHDPDGILEVKDERFNDFVIMFTISFFNELTGRWSSTMSTFMYWFAVRNPDQLIGEDFQRWIKHSDIVGMAKMSRDESRDLVGQSMWFRKGL